MSEGSQRIGYIALVVRDYDEAIAFYRDKLGFALVEDTQLSEESAGSLWNLKAQGARTSCWPGQQLLNRHQE